MVKLLDTIVPKLPSAKTRRNSTSNNSSFSNNSFYKVYKFSNIKLENNVQKITFQHTVQFDLTTSHRDMFLKTVASSLCLPFIYQCNFLLQILARSPMRTVTTCVLSFYVMYHFFSHSIIRH